MKFYFTIAALLFACIVVNGNSMHFWQLKPYIFNTTSGRLDGIFIRLIELYWLQCIPGASSIDGIEMTKSNTYQQFLQNMNTSSYDTNISASFFPILSDRNITYNYQRYRPVVYFKASGAMIIIRSDEIRAERKLWIGLSETTQFLLMSLMLFMERYMATCI